jgi:hypothetical protein
MRVKVTSEPPQGSIIRLAAVYKKDEHKNEHIKRCAIHTNSKELNESKSKGGVKMKKISYENHIKITQLQIISLELQI